MDRLAGGSVEALQGSSYDAPSGAELVYASPAVASRLTPDAAKVYSAASSGSDQGSDAIISRMPSLVFRTPDRQGGTYHLAFARGSRDERPGSLAFLHVVVLYPDTGSQVVYDTARVEGGRELAVEPMKHGCADGFHTEHLLIRMPDDVLAEHAAAGVRIRVSRPEGGMPFLLEVPSPHIEALLALRFPDGLHLSDAAERDAAERVSPEPEEPLNALHAGAAPGLVDESPVQSDGGSAQTPDIWAEDSADALFRDFETAPLAEVVTGARAHAYAEAPWTAEPQGEAPLEFEEPLERERVTAPRPQAETRARRGP